MPNLDDFLCALAHRDLVVIVEVCALFAELGLLLNLTKFVLELTRRIVSLGFTVDTATMTFEVSARRVAKMTAMVAELLCVTESESATAGLVASFPTISRRWRS